MSLSNLTAIQAAVAVAEERSFAAASRRLGLSTSATSKAVSRLEEELGVKLFRRTTRSVTVTPEGERFVDGARPVLGELSSLTEELRNTLARPRGLLRVSAPVAYGRMVLVKRLPEFLQAYREVRLELSLEDRGVDLVEDGIDVAIRTGNLPDNVSLVARRLFAYPLVTCAAPDYLARRGTPRSIEDLQAHECLNFRNARTGRAHPWRFENGKPLVGSGSLVVDDGEAVFRAAEAGIGVSQMPGFMAEGAIRRGSLVEVLRRFRPPDVPVSALYLDRRLVSPRVRAFVDFLARLQGSGP